MNIILRDPNGCCLYGQELAEHVLKTGRPLETYVVEGLELNNFVAFVRTWFPQFAEVQELYAYYETVGNEELKRLLTAVSDRVELTESNVKLMIEVQNRWVNYNERGNN
jgi:hypothetical protein